MTGSLKYPHSSQQSSQRLLASVLCVWCDFYLYWPTSGGHNQKKIFYQNSSHTSRLILISFLSNAINKLWSLPTSSVSPSIYFILPCARHYSKYYFCLNIPPYQIYKLLKDTQFIYLWHCLCLTQLLIQYLLHDHFNTSIKVLKLNFIEGKHQSEGKREHL